MKRTGIKRSTKPMTRSPMRRTRKTPRHQSLGVRARYSAEHATDDEWWTWLEFRPQEVREAEATIRTKQYETNHIFTAPRRDLVACLIRLRGDSHDYFHRRIKAGRVLSMAAKARKGESDLAVWRQAAHFTRDLRSWVSSVDLPEEIERFRVELLAWWDAQEGKVKS